MKKYLNISLLIALALAVAVPVSAMPSRVPAENSRSGRTVVIPENAVQISDHVFSLGTAIDPGTGKVVEGYAIVYPKERANHRPDHVRGGKKGGGENKCYAFLGRDAKWKNAESWLFNASNNEGLSVNSVFGILSLAIDEWEGAAETPSVFGSGSLTDAVLSADTGSPDDLNEVYFGDVSSSGAIAVTITWGIFGGPPSGRELVEWDMVFDEADFDWSDVGAPDKMDFENIAQHELGHALGLGHPDDSCLEETMFRFASNGETKKRDLNAGDIAGAAKLY